MLTKKQKDFLKNEKKGQSWYLLGFITFFVLGILHYKTKHFSFFYGNELGPVLTGFYFGFSLTAISLYCQAKKHLSLFNE